MLDDDVNGLELNEKFSFYYRLNEEGLSRDMKPNEFADQVKLISTISTFDEFWTVFQHIRKPDSCKSGTELFLFVKDVKPLWEDPNNTNGGKVSVRLRKNFSSIVWEEIVLAFIGQIFPEKVFQELTGIVISIRKECNVLQVWFKSFNVDKANIIEQSIKDLLQIPDGVEVETKPFFKNYFGVSNYCMVTPITSKIDSIPEETYKDNRYEDSFGNREYEPKNQNTKERYWEDNNERYEKYERNEKNEREKERSGVQEKIISVDEMFVDYVEPNVDKFTSLKNEKSLSTLNSISKGPTSISSVVIKNPDYEIEVNKIKTDDIEYEYEYEYGYNYDNSYSKKSKKRGKGYASNTAVPISGGSKYKEGYGDEFYSGSNKRGGEFNYVYDNNYKGFKRRDKFK